jgi:hypothetical protein
MGMAMPFMHGYDENGEPLEEISQTVTYGRSGWVAYTGVGQTYTATVDLSTGTTIQPTIEVEKKPKYEMSKHKFE